ncbi:hypothetical protein ACIGQE_07750 [Streptomyces sp. NPDC053429]|uniref:hypothetical protein n=1 Tax=Streptomyces sp. NPDC053429 TaxID=3365702 RepID=UPI0037D16890
MTQARQELRVSFADVDLATANQLAEDLQEALAEEAPDATRQREDPLSQDFGATLVIILGSTAVTALAKGIAKWLARRQDARVQLKRTMTDGRVIDILIDGQATRRTERLIIEFLEK